MAGQASSFVYFGSDEGAAGSAAAAKYVELTSAGGDEGWGNEVLDGVAATVDEAVAAVDSCISSLQMMSMFGGPKTIWLKGANFLSDSPSGARSEAVQAALERLVDCLQHLPDATYFVLSATEVDKRRAFFKKLSSVAEMHESQRIDISKPGWETEVSALTLSLAAPLGLKFDNAALALFVQRVNENSRQIVNELNKLDVYLGPERRVITEQDVELMVAVSRHGFIFEISRAIERRDSRAAVRLVNAQLEQGEQAVSIMRAAIVPTVRNRYCARLMLDSFPLNMANSRAFDASLQKLPPEARKLLPRKKDGSLSSFPFYQAAGAVSNLSLAKAREHLLACAQADRRLVSSQANARDVLHKLIILLTS